MFVGVKRNETKIQIDTSEFFCNYFETLAHLQLTLYDHVEPWKCDL